MKTYFVAAAFAVAFVGAVGCAAPAEEADEAVESSEDALTSWQNVLIITVPGAGYINTLQTPHLTLRPVRGRYMKMSWPATCNAQFTGMSLYGASLTGQRLPLSAQIAAGPQLEAGGRVAAYYSINGGLGATVREIGLFGFIGGPCEITFEHNDTLTSGGGGGGGQAISGYSFSGFGQCRSLAAGSACPAVANALTDMCLDRGGRTSYCEDCSALCSVSVQ